MQTSFKLSLLSLSLHSHSSLLYGVRRKALLFGVFAFCLLSIGDDDDDTHTHM